MTDVNPANATIDRAESARLFWALHTGGWFAYSAFSYLISLAYGKPPSYWKVAVFTGIVGFVCTLGMRYLFRAFLRLSPLKFFAAAAIPVTLVSLLMGLVYGRVIVEWCGECRPSSLLGYVAYMSSFVYIVLSWTGLYYGIKNYQKSQIDSATALRATAMAHQAQLKMLRYQLNPHFLFNTLNAISTLILDQDNGTANRMVTSLSAFLRHSLDADPMQRVTLKQELDALQLYLGIEKLRFAERLRLVVDIEPSAYQALLPSLLLQPLIENAIKHAVAKRVEGGELVIAAQRRGERLWISVSDDGPGFCQFEADGLPAGRGVGLRNTRERLRVLYGEQQRFDLRAREPRGAEIIIELPFETGGGQSA